MLRDLAGLLSGALGVASATLGLVCVLAVLLSGFLFFLVLGALAAPLLYPVEKMRARQRWRASSTHP